MSWEATGWAKKQKTGSPSAKALLLVIADHWNPEGHCFAAQKTLADESEQSIDAVQRHLMNLQRRGLIARERRGKLGGGRTSDLIVLLMPGVIYRANHRTVAVIERPPIKRTHPLESVGANAANRGSAAAAPVRPLLADAAVPERVEAAGGAPNHDGSLATSPTAPVRSNPTAPVRYESYLEPKIEPKGTRPAQNTRADPDAEPLQGAANAAGATVFVFENSEPWQAWVRYRESRGIPGRPPVTTRDLDGDDRRGAWLPSLYPPNGSFELSGVDDDQRFERIAVGSPELTLYVAYIRQKSGEREAASVEYAACRKGDYPVPAQWLRAARLAIEARS